MPSDASLGRIRYDANLLKLMSFFEASTKAKLRDCFVDGNGLLVFVVESAQYGLAVGREGANVRRVEESLKRKVKIVEFSDDLATFVNGLIQPLKASSVDVAEGVVTIAPASASDRGLLIGRGGKNVHNFQTIVQRYFPIKELKIA